MATPLPSYIKNLMPAKGPRAEEALQRFLKKGLPTQKDEDWRYTGLHAIEKQNYLAPKIPALFNAPAGFAPHAVARLLFVNGIYQPSDTPLPQGLRVISGSPLATHTPTDSWQDLNEAMAGGGFTLQLDKNKQLPGPVEIMYVHVSDIASSYHVRNHIRLHELAELDLIEYHVSQTEAPAFITHDQLIEVGTGAKLNRTLVLAGSAEESRLAHDQVSLQRDSQCGINLIQKGGRITRRNITVSHDGNGAASRINAVNIADGKGHIDLLTDMRHMVAHTTSAQQVRTLAGGTAKAVFQGKVLVAENAQKTEAAQAHHGLLLSNEAEIDAKPGLEIYADDVKCSHGATCGALDAEAMFYLRSRGVPINEAQSLLLQAFTADAFDGLPDEQLKTRILTFLQEGHDQDNDDATSA